LSFDRWCSPRSFDFAARLVLLGLVLTACGGSGSAAQRDTTANGVPAFVGQPTSVALIPEPIVTPAPTPKPGKTAKPVATAKPGPTAKPDPTAKPLSVNKVSLTGSVSRGGTAKVTIKTDAHADCSIEVTYNSGPSTAAGLGDKTANDSGSVSWSWRVGSNTARGSYPIDIWCSKGERGDNLSLTFRVT
jgi:hypothetical protein